jgi:regulator of CtrA degradation
LFDASLFELKEPLLRLFFYVAPGLLEFVRVATLVQLPGERAAKMNEDKPVDFMARFASSEPFERVFREGMGLVEETADYLDGPGRKEARLLDREGAVAYATESMRLTTRLMQMASWLLLQRAMQAGEITRDDAQAEKRRINLEAVGPAAPVAGGNGVPEGLTSLINRSLRLHERILTLDRSLAGPREAEAGENPVGEQLEQLAKAFGAG